MFMVGLISNAIFYFPAVIIEFLFIPPPVSVLLTNQVEIYYENAHLVLMPIVFVFGQLLSAWLTLKLICEKSNYFYLIILAIALVVIQYFILEVYSEINKAYFFWVFNIIGPAVLAITANHFIKKQTK